MGAQSNRPTTDRVREAWASTLVSLVPGGSLENLRILDAFAGSGALGLELLSRGALSCVFLEKDKRTLSVLRKNIESLGLTSTKAQLALQDTLSPQLSSFIKHLGPFDLLILDPPYSLAQSRVQELLAHLVEFQLLQEGSLISYEHSAATEEHMDGLLLGALPSALYLKLVKSKKYGTINLDYYRCCTAVEEER